MSEWDWLTTILKAVRLDGQTDSRMGMYTEVARTAIHKRIRERVGEKEPDLSCQTDEYGQCWDCGWNAHHDYVVRMLDLKETRDE